MRKRSLCPRGKTALDSFWVDMRKHTIEGIMRWNTSRKRQECLKPCSFLVRDNSNFREGICATDGTTYRHDENFDEYMTFIMVFAIIRDDTEVCDQGEFRSIHRSLRNKKWTNTLAYH